ncbi:MAG: hypothetical protein GHCLOJNM_01970 [bacterium]|nr:hypothetical protein [bacterium]
MESSDRRKGYLVTLLVFFVTAGLLYLSRILGAEYVCLSISHPEAETVFPIDLNERGEVVGTVNGLPGVTVAGFLWDRDKGMRFFGNDHTLYWMDVNNRGQVCGAVKDGSGMCGFIWSETGGFRIHRHPDYPDNTSLIAINDAGRAIASAGPRPVNATNTLHLFEMDEHGAFGRLDPNAPPRIGYSVNAWHANGLLVGTGTEILPGNSAGSPADTSPASQTKQQNVVRYHLFYREPGDGFQEIAVDAQAGRNFHFVTEEGIGMGSFHDQERTHGLPFKWSEQGYLTELSDPNPDLDIVDQNPSGEILYRSKEWVTRRFAGSELLERVAAAFDPSLRSILVWKDRDYFVERKGRRIDLSRYLPRGGARVRNYPSQINERGEILVMSSFGDELHRAFLLVPK